MEIENTSDYYKTSDLYEAAFLCTCSGVQHVGQEKIGAKFFFLFKSKLQCEILSKLLRWTP